MDEEKHSPWRYVLIAAIVARLYVRLQAFFPEIDLQQLLQDFSDTLGHWTYLVVGALAFLETGAFVGLIVPGETFVMLGRRRCWAGGRRRSC